MSNISEKTSSPFSQSVMFVVSEKASPWPKFDKAVSELHDWLNTLSNMMKTEKIVLGDSEDMEGLLEKQKVLNHRHRINTRRFQ